MSTIRNFKHCRNDQRLNIVGGVVGALRETLQVETDSGKIWIVSTLSQEESWHVEKEGTKWTLYRFRQKQEDRIATASTIFLYVLHRADELQEFQSEEPLPEGGVCFRYERRLLGKFLGSIEAAKWLMVHGFRVPVDLKSLETEVMTIHAEAPKPSSNYVVGSLRRDGDGDGDGEPKKIQKGKPRDLAQLSDFQKALKSGRRKGCNKKEIALDFTDGDIKKANALLRMYRYWAQRGFISRVD
jgi:hypothetical protein